MADGTHATGTWPISVSGSSTSCTGNAYSTSVDGTCIAYAGWSNEFNFGGSNNSSTIYIGYRAMDSKPIPTSFIFGGSGGSSTITAGGATLNGALNMNGRINLRINGGAWYNPIITPNDSGIWYDASNSTSSTYWSIASLKFPNTTFSLGGERSGNVFGIYSYSNSRTENGTDGGFYVNGSNHYFYCSTRLYGAVWNDYAEFRNQNDEIKPGYCVASTNNGKVHKTTKHLQACDGIVSDTYGFSIGETDDCKTPLAVSGRVLAYCEGNAHDYNAGDTVGASANGKVIKMTREEIKEYPDRIVGIVSEIPEYETWGTGKVNVDGRIWIKIK